MNKDFYIYLLIPYIVFLLGGLIFALWLSLSTVWVFIILPLALIFSSTKIYGWIFMKNQVPLRRFVIESEINQNLVKVFQDLLPKTDEEIERTFEIYSVELMDLFTQKIDEGIEKEEKQKFIYELLKNFKDNFEKRTLWAIFTSNFWKKFLEWHLKVWRQKFPSLIRLQDVLQKIFHTTFGKILSKEGYLYLCDFFGIFVEHINNSTEEKKRIFNKEGLYIEFFLNDFCDILFEEGPKSPHHDEIWKLIPYEWKITPENLKKNIISRILLNKFLAWARNRINAYTEEWDKCLDEVAMELFPETEPFLWAEILTFALSVYEKENRVKSVIEKPRIFGFIGRTLDIDLWSDEIEKEEQLEREYRQKQIRSTLELLKTVKRIFGDTFSKENIEKYLKEIEILEKEYEKDEDKYERLQRLKMIFEVIREK